MAGNADNTVLFGGADVYIAPENTAGPDDTVTAWAAAWKAVGLLDGDDGITESRDGDSSEHYAWGGQLYRTTKSKHKRTFKFIALEDNDTTFALVNPGSTRVSATGVRTSTIKVPTTERFGIGFELRDGDRIKRRIIKHAEVQDIAEIKESESDPTVFEITVVVYPEADGTLYTTVEDDPTA
jgi:hypothetical protein